MKNAVLCSALAALLAAGCAGANKKDAAKVSLSFQAQLDSGNAAYRRQDYKKSTEYFHLAAKSDPNNLSGWYGIYMAESKLGNTEEANMAKAKVAKEAPYMPLTEHPTAADHPAPALNAPRNPHVPQSGETKAELPIDSLRAAKGKQ